MVSSNLDHCTSSSTESNPTLNSSLISSINHGEVHSSVVNRYLGLTHPPTERAEKLNSGIYRRKAVFTQQGGFIACLVTVCSFPHAPGHRFCKAEVRNVNM